MELLNTEIQGTNTYLVYQLAEGDVLDTLSLGMLLNNEIKNVSPLVFTQKDEAKFLKYNITAKVPASNFLGGTVNRRQLLGLLSGITEGILAAEDYLINPSMFLLDTDYIFVQVSSCEASLICRPLENLIQGPLVDIPMYFKKILFGTHFDQSENTNYVAEIVNYLNEAGEFSLRQFSVLLKGLSSGSKEAVPAAVLQNIPARPTVSAPPPKPAPVIAKPSQQAAKAPVVPPPNSRAQVLPKPIVTEPPRPAPPPPPAAKPAQAYPYAIPNHAGPSMAPAPRAVPSPGGEEEMSWLYLMQHYNKENKAAYDAQKRSRKELKSQNKKAKNENQPPPPPGYPQAPPGVPVSPQVPVYPVAFQHAPPAPQASAPQPPAPAPEPVPVPVPQPAVSSDANFGGTVVLTGDRSKGTTLLGQAPVQQRRPHLIRVRNSEKITLPNGLLRVGRDKSAVEYCISDNDAVSSYHAEFSCNAGDCYVTDMNSTNHTYVDGVMIQSMKGVQLSHGTRVKLGNEEFIFNLY